ncbi:cuticle protein-like [Anopheles ziemanni]|uniref:cuticle protein-like n=1 Tax=Anopheles coustani TaxID=139045 RepID=UPI002658F6A1|nr:cuticle protein-like [Anopheles coustani]XP_058174380.1 cuticle protein-like [Anopheles ziemanni]
MAFKFVTFAALVAVARAGLIAQPALSYAAAPALLSAPVAKVAYATAPIAKVAYAAQPEEYDANPQYSFSYGISDALTGDSKSQQESRSGDVVQGSYSVVDPDGTKRTVEYTADPHNGFNAVVHREPLTKAVPALAYAAPVAKTISYAAPVAKTISYSAPVATKTIVSSQPALSYAAPAYATQAYAAPVAKTYISSQPALSYAAPVAKTYISSQPALSYAAPAYATQAYAAPAYASYH